jgi:hypothetical protein
MGYFSAQLALENNKQQTMLRMHWIRMTTVIKKKGNNNRPIE